MKCARVGCYNPAHKTIGKYCSAQCAPFGLLGKSETNTPSGYQTRRSSSQEPGDQLPQSLNDASPREHELAQGHQSQRNGVNDQMFTANAESRSSSRNDEDQDETSTAHAGTDGTQETESGTSSENESEDSDENLPTESQGSSIYFVEENLTSSNLIKESAEHLRDLMKSVAKVPDDDEVRGLDPNRVNAACNCAKQIHNLMKLQLDVLKEVRSIAGEK